MDKKDNNSVNQNTENISIFGLDEQDIEKEIDMLLSREMIHIMMDTNQANFLPTQVKYK